MIKHLLFALVVLIALLSHQPPVRAQFHDINDKDGIARDRADLLELARAANLPPDEQLRELPHIYRDIWVMRPRVADAVGVDSQMMQQDSRVTTLSPEDFVKEVEEDNPNRLQNTAFDVCKNLLGPRASELAPQIIEGLLSSDKRQRFAAIMLIEHAWSFPQKGEEKPPSLGTNGIQITEAQAKAVRKSPLQVFFKPLFSLLRKDPDDHYVTLAISRFQRQRVRDFLIENVVTGKDHYQFANYLAQLIAYRRPPRALLKALSSPNVHIRRAAAETFYESGSSVLVPYIKQLAQDTDARVRIGAAVMALKLSVPDWERVRESISALIADSDAEVRGQVTGLVSAREGKTLAKDVLRLIQDDSLSQLAHIYIYQAMCKIGGSDFGYEEDFRRDNWRPTTLANRAAIQRFAEWVRVNVRGNE